ncbi:hypothetical protein EDB84DRAFT_1480526 [Lactarius hengduanensis]|nr:hypothetical protein EDB84DRAFT_1480526 [Lactarius hengduanensis]
MSESLSGGRSTIYQASITVVTVFMSVEVPLLFFIKDDSNFPKSIESHAKQVILTFAYTSVFFSLSATISGFILPYMPVKLPAQMPQASQGYEARPPLTWLELHWMLSLIGATVIPIAQVLLYVWFEESNTIRITLTAITVFALLPLVQLIPFPSGRGRRH